MRSELGLRIEEIVTKGIVGLAFVAVLVGLGAEPTWAGDVAKALQPGAFFRKHVIDPDFSNGYQVSAADVDSDGDVDVIALSTEPSQLVWYRNPSWERISIGTRTQRNIDCAPYDIDGDGDPDLAVASDFDLADSTHGGNVQWLECPDDPVVQREWEVHPIDAIPTSHRVRWVDLDGSGSKALLNLPIIGVGATSPDYAAAVVFKAYSIPADPRNDPWPARVVDDTLTMAHGICVVDWDHDSRDDILTASFDGVQLFRWNGTAFTKDWIGAGHAGARPTIGSSEVALGKLESEHTRFVATIEPWHGNEVAAYAEPATSVVPWSRTVIDDALEDGHALACVDVDGDGNDEIVAGGRRGTLDLYMYRWSEDWRAWKRTALDTGGLAAAGLFVADINDDNRPDLVAIGTSTHNVVWFENTFTKD